MIGGFWKMNRRQKADEIRDKVGDTKIRTD